MVSVERSFGCIVTHGAPFTVAVFWVIARYCFVGGQLRRSLAFSILIVCGVFGFWLGVLLYEFRCRFERYLRSVSRGLRLRRRRFNHMERAVFVFLLSFYIVRDFFLNRRGSVFKSTGVSYFGISSIRFQTIKMYLLPLFLILACKSCKWLHSFG